MYIKILWGYVKMAGKLSVVYGSMKSGKSFELIRQQSVLTLGKKKNVLIVKPSIDNRFSKDEVISRTGARTNCIIVDHTSKECIENMYDKHKGNINAILIDEIQFFNLDILDVIEKFLLDNIDVYCYGLNLNFLNEPFDIMKELIPLADDVKKLYAICENCGSDHATHNFLIDTNGVSDSIKIGDEVYKAVCRTCYYKLKGGE